MREAVSAAYAATRAVIAALSDEEKQRFKIKFDKGRYVPRPRADSRPGVLERVVRAFEVVSRAF